MKKDALGNFRSHEKSDCHDIGETFEYIVSIYRHVGSSSTLRGQNLKRALYVSDIGGPTMVGVDAAGKILILNPLEWLKTASPG